MSCIALLGEQTLLPACGDPSAGRAFFEQRCQQRHRADHTPATDISGLLKSDRIRPHRFHLTDPPLRDLDACRTEIKAGNR